MSKSGKVVGAEYVERVERYLGGVDSLPILPSGAVNVSAIADSAQVPRQSLYKNPAIRAMLDAAKEKAGLKSQHDLEHTETPDVEGSPAASARQSPKQQQVLERRVNKLEQQNAALVAENAELRRQLKELRLAQGREDMAIETGRRIPAPRTHG